MKLIPEQLKGIEKAAAELKEERKSFKAYIDERRETNERDGYKIICIDHCTEDEIITNAIKLSKLQKIVDTAEIIDTPNNNQIGIGSTFKLKMADDLDDDELEEYTLVEKAIGVTIFDGYISLDSKLGQSVYGKHVGENFSYKLSPKANDTVTGTIVSIGKDNNKVNQK